ncbi:MAG: hypothetical protein MUE72_10185, partial [Chitinophagaceae bacterium]|nr:hypothetical protein [Chitinophagaceae bacterium]
MENTNESSLFDFSIDNIAANELNTAGKWAKRLAIVSITCIALVSIAFIFMGIAFADIFGNYLPREYSQLVSLQSSGIVFTIILLII